MMESAQLDVRNNVAPGKQAAQMPSFAFDGFQLRPAVEADFSLAQYWNNADPDHRHRTKPAFWLEQGASVNSFLLHDAIGPVFFFRIDVDADTVEIHMQFSPDSSAGTRLRTMNAMSIGLRWLEKRLSSVGCNTIYFNSRTPRLIMFCQQRLGFAWDGRRLEKKLPEVTNG